MGKTTHNTLAAERRKARHYGMQALYQWMMAGAALSDIEAEFRAEYDFSHVDLEYFQALLHGVPGQVEELEAVFEPLLDRSLKELDEAGAKSLNPHEPDARMMKCSGKRTFGYNGQAVSEVALAKKFGASESHKYINGVLDKAARQLRKAETGS